MVLGVYVGFQVSPISSLLAQISNDMFPWNFVVIPDNLEVAKRFTPSLAWRLNILIGIFVDSH